MTTTTERVDTPPDACPRCGETWWAAYRLIDVAPACGCNNCGYLVLLKEKPAWVHLDTASGKTQHLVEVASKGKHGRPWFKLSGE